MQASLNEHDGAITCFATATSSNALPSLASLAQAAAAAANSSKQQEAGSQSSSSTSSKKNSTSNSGSLLASGATDGTVRIWDLGASIPQASSHVLSSPYGGASVSTLAVAPSYWGSIGAVSDASSASGSASMANNKALSIVVVGYGGASAQATPSMSVWHRGQVGCTDILHVHSCAHVPSLYSLHGRLYSVSMHSTHSYRYYLSSFLSSLLLRHLCNISRHPPLLNSGLCRLPKSLAPFPLLFLFTQPRHPLPMPSTSATTKCALRHRHRLCLQLSSHSHLL